MTTYTLDDDYNFPLNAIDWVDSLTHLLQESKNVIFELVKLLSIGLMRKFLLNLDLILSISALVAQEVLSQPGDLSLEHWNSVRIVNWTLNNRGLDWRSLHLDFNRRFLSLGSRLANILNLRRLSWYSSFTTIFISIC